MTSLQETNPMEITIPHELYDSWIYTDFPHIQQNNRASQDAPLNIDLSQCEWASPLPLLALATECMAYSSADRRININLGEGGAGARAENQSRARRFLSLHGFLDAFASRKDLFVRFQFDQTGEKGSNGHWHDASCDLRSLRVLLEKARVDLLYGDTIVLPATTWSLPCGDDPNLSANIRKQVDKLLRRADVALYKFKTEARKYRNVTLQRLNQVLLELVENAAEHAYLNSTGGYVGLYARVRQAGNETASAYRDKELLHSPLLGNLLLSEKQHQIELFVVDVGRGLLSDIATWRSSNISNPEELQPLRKTAGMLFIQPLSRHDRTNDSVARERGSSTGLMHLHNILSHQNDTSRIVTGNEWIAGPHPRPQGFTPDTVTAGLYQQHASGNIKGTLFHIGISPSEIPPLDSQWFASDETSNAKIRNSIIKKFALVSLPKTLETQVIDIRTNEGLENIGKLVNERASNSTGTVVRVNRIAEKNLVNSIITAWLDGIGNLNKYSPTLYLCDLGRYQAVDVAWVIKKFFYASQRFDMKVEHKDALILLVTEDLCCTQFKVRFEKRDIGKSKKAICKFVASAEQSARDIDKLENRLVFVLSELRNCDTKKLWSSINRLNIEWLANPVLIENVLWGKDKNRVLPNYLNFSSLVQDEEAARCVRRSLRRILALYPDANDYALDGLVESSLHDAKKWLVRPQQETNRRVLIGSISVSGSTLNRYKPNPQDHIEGVIDCIRSPYYAPPQREDYFHLAALLWDPSLPVETHNAPRYQRIGKSAFVERIDDKQKLQAITQYDENLYDELETSKLIKLGHWAYGDRHCLLEVNAELAIEQSWVSESGPIPSLAQKLTDWCKQQPVVLSFPVDKLAYRLAHHVKSKVSYTEKTKVTLLPLSYLPRIAGGITKFAPLVFDAASQLSKGNGKEQPLAVFLDFGFITNRTMRHSVRQLHDAGFRQVEVMGLLNRSSAPALDFENRPNQSTPIPIPQAYWRWNVPTMGSGTHCFLCNSLHSLARLRRLFNEAHIDLLGPLEAVGRNWAARDAADFWDEYGLSPKMLSDQMRQSLTPLFPNVQPDRLPSTSCTLSARVIEQFRATGDSTFPLSVAKRLISTNGNEQAVELISTILALANSSFTPADMHEYVDLLAQSSIDLGTQPYAQQGAERISRLLDLVALIFATRDRMCKLETQERLCLQLEVKDITDIPHLRIALIALTTDSDESEEVQKAFHKRCTDNRTKTILTRNYHAIRPTKGTAKDTWGKLTQAFGRSESHSQQSALGGLLEEFSRTTAPSKTVPRLAHIASLLGQCDKNFVMDCFEVDLDDVINNVQELSNHACAESTQIGAFNESVARTFHSINTRLHLALKRFGDRADSPMIYDLFYDALIQQASINKMSFDVDIAITRSAAIIEWRNELGGYLPICNQITNLFGEIFSNIKGRSTKLPPPALPEFSGLQKEMLGWIWFDTQCESQDKGITVVFVTGPTLQNDVVEYRPKISGLKEWGVDIQSKNITSENRKYFEIRVRIPSLATVMEEL